MKSGSNLCIGIDIGGTNTDAVLLKDRTILANTKVTTTPDARHGVITVIKNLFKQTGVSPTDITLLVIGTTHFVNTILQTKGLNEVMVIRLAKPATTAVEPMLDWPESLRKAIGGHREIIAGGHEYHGKEIAPLDCARLKELAHIAKAKAIKAAAITGVFAHVNPEHEIKAQQILNDIYPEIQITLSHLVGKLNLLPRENTTILNAALSTQFNQFHDSLKRVIEDLQLAHATLFFTTNDGTLEHPYDIFPITTYGSGTSNSMRGAVILTEEPDAVVADIGGTSTDVGILKNGFPLETGYETKIGNEKEYMVCNFPAPLMRSCGLGGGSIIRINGTGTLEVGPHSVGYQLTKEARIFGGNTLTVTDIAVAKGRLNLGDCTYLTDIDPKIIQQADDIIHRKLADMINHMLYFCKTNKALPLILVGGGACLFDQQKLRQLLSEKIANIQLPPQAGYTNALGAAIAKVSGSYHSVFQYANVPGLIYTPREDAIILAKQQATQNAIAKGANPATITIQEIEEIPINYLPGNQTRLRIKVIGERKQLNLDKQNNN